ncbi:Uncharacterised protein (plasmid) [Tsukamurella tyrosinosolvens]|uniref:Uncharacterized protein n=1 Tax=Tsukamurella tyrosinosolvens TaxID=57704 RepID=A0A1H4VN38_TSUTY|nr:hypothetical protein [Tsukamurella tyrosinosolvens]KXO90931.1 hypothetical protein AXK58_21085 [Tsukamurella tyrosinosolvens]SEC82446.1 hypothetical protein SAMN04489793_3282 [Tsukamurella tyrosinosolvens]VEH90409.1 Uncharacterised protein [Tsukamurella tyrosinosolvens]
MSIQSGVDVTLLFAGDGRMVPDTAEWARADQVFAEHGLPPLARSCGRDGHPEMCNRAWMRAQMRRALREAGVAVTYEDGSVGWGVTT